MLLCIGGRLIRLNGIKRPGTELRHHAPGLTTAGRHVRDSGWGERSTVSASEVVASPVCHRFSKALERFVGCLLSGGHCHELIVRTFYG